MIKLGDQVRAGNTALDDPTKAFTGVFVNDGDDLDQPQVSDLSAYSEVPAGQRQIAGDFPDMTQDRQVPERLAIHHRLIHPKLPMVKEV